MEWLNEIWAVREIILPALDILLISFILYKGYMILVQTRAIQLVKGALFMAFMYALAFFLNLRTLQWILNLIVPSLVIGIAIIFQPELRKIFTRIGQGEWFKMSSTSRPYQLDSVLNAVEMLSGRRRGALIVFLRNVGIKNIIDTGTKLDADISSSLLLTIFEHDTPLHDGAVILDGRKVIAAGCFLPLSEQMNIRRSFGTRHRAALGLAEETDAVVVVVSEETGAVSLAYDANLRYDLSIEETRSSLVDLLHFPEDGNIEKEVVALEE
jgi:diadenylate cyclase